MVLELNYLRVGVEHVLSDDYRTMRKQLHHGGAHKGGKLSFDVPQPQFLCDPVHRIKVMIKDIF